MVPKSEASKNVAETPYRILAFNVDNQLSTNVSGIWAFGDPSGRGGLARTSYNGFDIVAANFLNHERRSATGHIIANKLYTDSPLGGQSRA